jgi:hypothetical protein
MFSRLEERIEERLEEFWFWLTSRATPRRVRRKQLEVQDLEERVVPSTYIWTGAANNGEYADAGNWSSTDGGTSYPNSVNDTATLEGSQTIRYENFRGNNVSGTLGGLTASGAIEDPFTGTFSLRANLQINGLQWQGGTLDFNAAAYTLDLHGGANNTFGVGTIGNSDSLGTLKVDNNAVLTITAPSDGYTSVTLGVPLVIGGDETNPKVLVKNFNVNMPSTSTVTTTVNAGGTLEFADTLNQSYTFGPSSAVSSDYIKGVGGNITFDANDSWTVNTAMWNTGATVQFQTGATVLLNNGSSATNTRSYYQTGTGTTILGSSGGTLGAGLTCSQGFFQDGGSLQTYSTATSILGVGTRAPQIAYIVGGSIKVGADLTGDNYGKLMVQGTLDISGTTAVYISVSRANGNNRTQIEGAGAFTIDNSYGSNQTTVYVTMNGLGNVTMWKPFYSDFSNQFTGQFATVSNGFKLDSSDGQNDFLTKV